MSAWALQALLPALLGLDEIFAYKIAVAVGGHHGVWPRQDELDFISDSKHPQWEQVRRDLFRELASVFEPPSNVAADEVHAYDTYMNTIFHLLLTWLNAIGTSVIVLSATLPSSTRRALVKAYTGSVPHRRGGEPAKPSWLRSPAPCSPQAWG